MDVYPSKVVIFGATGNLGRSIILALLANNKHKVRAVTRSTSNNVLPSGVEVMEGQLDSVVFLRKCVSGQDVVIIALGFEAESSIEDNIVAAASAAAVKFVLPNEFVSQDSLRKEFPFGIHEKKNRVRSLVEQSEQCQWIAIVNGVWYDVSLISGAYGIDIRNRRATIWSSGTVKANATTLTRVGQSVASLLSLSYDRLQTHGNRCVYISSFRASQDDILRSVQQATNTSDVDWDIKREDAAKAVQDGQAQAARGSFAGFLKAVHAAQFISSGGGDYESEHGTVNDDLGLSDESLDDATRAAISSLSK